MHTIGWFYIFFFNEWNSFCSVHLYTLFLDLERSEDCIDFTMFFFPFSVLDRKSRKTSLIFKKAVPNDWKTKADGRCLIRKIFLKFYSVFELTHITKKFRKNDGISLCSFLFFHKNSKNHLNSLKCSHNIKISKTQMWYKFKTILTVFKYKTLKCSKIL